MVKSRTFGATLAILLLAVALPTEGRMHTVTPQPVAVGLEASGAGRNIDLALCLDTSGSMSGLIDAARQKLWSIVNQLALAEPTPRLRVALLTFGHDSYEPDRGWVRLDLGLTDDLDAVSQRLFELETNGGTEYVGRVVQTALQRLDWDASNEALKLIVVAGNESAEQDPQVRNDQVAASAIGRGIMINAIYCGNPADNLAPGWQAVSRRADGHFASIDHHDGTVVVETPFDGQLASLSTLINDTYIPLGQAGRAGLEVQDAQDSNASSLNGEASASRAVTKAGKLFRKHWDLVDAIAEGTVRWDTLDGEQLPEEMKRMTLDEQKVHVAAKQKQRDELREQIQQVDQQRRTYIAEEMTKSALDDSKSFDQAIRRAIEAQATSKGFRFQPANDDSE